MTVLPGEIHALLGQNGSGKSTLIKVLAGVYTPDPGSQITVYGDELRPGLPRESRRLGLQFVHQALGIIGHLTAVENVALPQELDGVRKGAARRAALAALEEVGILELADRFPDEMSGGQQQRVAIARAVVGERRLILADEPTGALDTDTGEDILRLLRARCDDGATGVLVTHEARHAAWADRVVFLRDGIVVDESGADRPDALLAPEMTR